MKLIPTSVTVSANLKSFGLMDGVSSGTDLSMTCSVPAGTTLKELSEEITRIEIYLGFRLLEMERTKGVFPAGILDHIKNNLTSRLEHVKRNSGGSGEAVATDTGTDP